MQTALDINIAEFPTGDPDSAIGIDCVYIPRVSRSIDRWGPSFLQRLFTDAESDYCRGKRFSAQHFAGRLAAKEAVYKAFRPAWRSTAFTWKDIEITHDSENRPDVVLHAGFLAAVPPGFRGTISVSITHAGEYAVAVALVRNNE